MTNYQLCFYKPELTFHEFMELEQKEPEFWKEYVKYCEYDCESLYLVWEKFKAQIDTIIGKMGDWLKGKVSLNTCNTIGSLSKKLIDTINGVKNITEPTKEMEQIRRKYKNGYKWKFGVCVADYKAEVKALKESGNELREVVGITGKDDFKKYCEFMGNDETKYNFVKNFKRGGISHSNQQGFHKEGVCGFDIKSQYPTALMNMKIPVGTSRWVGNYEDNSFGFYLINNIIWSDDVKSFKPVANKKENGVLDWATNNFKDLYCDSYMIKYLQENCGLVSFSAKLLKTSVVDRYGLRGKPKLTQVAMIADMIDEPSYSNVVDMLHALPREEAEYYSREENVVIQCASSESIFQAHA